MSNIAPSFMYMHKNLTYICSFSHLFILKDVECGNNKVCVLKYDVDCTSGSCNQIPLCQGKIFVVFLLLIEFTASNILALKLCILLYFH